MGEGPRRDRTEGRWRWLGWVIVIVFGGGSVLAYIALAMTINGQPPYKPFPGWVAVMQPYNESYSDTVQLQVDSLAVGNHPRVQYIISVCGPRPSYNADLLIGGSAQLTDVHGLLPPFGTPGSLPELQRLPDLRSPAGGLWTSGSVQVLPISFNNDVTPCASGSWLSLHSGLGVQSNGLFLGSLGGITGLASAPIQQSWTWPSGWWHGPRLSQAWPLIGALPGAQPDLGVYAFRALNGAWMRPPMALFQVNAINVPYSWSINTAQPALSSSNTLNWSSQDPISPMAQLTDSDSLTTIQNWLVVAGVGMGIAGSMLASLLFEMLRRPSGRVGAINPAPSTPVSRDRNQQDHLG